MRKTIIHCMALAALAMGACSQQDDFGTADGGSASRAIEFTTFVAHRTRVGDVTNENVTGETFRLWGEKSVDGESWLPVFEQYGTDDNNATTLTYYADRSEWLTRKLAFWERGYSYLFRATNAGVSEDGCEDPARVNFDNLTISRIPATQHLSPTNHDQGKDYLVAAAEAAGDGLIPVQLSFSHVLSKLAVFARTPNENATDLKLNKLNIYLPSGEKTATYDILAGTTTYDDFTPQNTAATSEQLLEAGYEKWELLGESDEPVNLSRNIVRKYSDEELNEWSQTSGLSRLIKKFLELEPYDPITENADPYATFLFLHPDIREQYEYMDSVFQANGVTYEELIGMSMEECYELDFAYRFRVAELTYSSIFAGFSSSSFDEMQDYLFSLVREFMYDYEQPEFFEPIIETYSEELLLNLVCQTNLAGLDFRQYYDLKYGAAAHRFEDEFYLAATDTVRLYVDVEYSQLGCAFSYPLVPVTVLTSFESGTFYNLYIDIGGDVPITFSVGTIEEWKSENLSYPDVTSNEMPAPSSGWVDMGPAGVWATCNIGAENPYDLGDYFQWGGRSDLWGGDDTYDSAEGDRAYEAANAPYFTGIVERDGHTENGFGKYVADYDDWLGYSYQDLNEGDDAAVRHCGNSWRMPTDEEWSCLLNTEDYAWEWVERDAVPTAPARQRPVSGFRVTFIGDGYPECVGNSIFLPAGGCRIDTRTEAEPYGDGHILSDSFGACYWSSTLYDSTEKAQGVAMFKPSNAYGDLNSYSTEAFYRHYGMQVRPVRR